MTTSSIFNEMSQTAHVESKGCMCMLVTKLYLTLCDLMEPARLLCPWDSPGKSTGVGCHCLLQGNFPNQGSNPCLLHWQVGSLPLSHQRH